MGQYKNTKQFTANIFFNSSWALFSPAPKCLKQEEEVKGGAKKRASAKKTSKQDALEFNPFSFFGKTFTFDKIEQKIIKDLRAWIISSFEKHAMVSGQYITRLEDMPQVGKKQESGKYYDVDLQVKVLQLFKIDEYSTEMRVVDESNEIWFG